MAVSSFENLCIAVCELAGVPVPALAEDEFGMTAFTLEVRGLAIGVIRQRERPDAAGLLGSLGRFDPPDDARACQLLMESNFLAGAHPDPPVIGRNPATGEFVLSLWRRLDSLSPTDVFAAAERVANVEASLRARLASIGAQT